MAGVISARKLTNNNTDVIAIEEVDLIQAELKLAGDNVRGGKPSRSKKHGFDRKYYSKREARRLQRSIEMIACLSEMEEDDEENVFSLDELGEKSEQHCDAFQISVNLKRKAYRRCKHKSLNESFEAQKNEPRILSQLFQPYPTTDVARGKETILRLDSGTRVDLTCEEKASLSAYDHDLSLSKTPPGPPLFTEVDSDFFDTALVPQQSAPVVCVPTSRQIFKSSFKRLQAKDAAMSKSKQLARPAPPRPQEVKQVVVVRRQPDSCALLALPRTTPSPLSPIKSGWIQQSKLYQKRGPKAKNMSSFRSLAQRLFG